MIPGTLPAGEATRRVRRNAVWDAKLCTTGQAMVRGLEPIFIDYEYGHDLSAPLYVPAGSCDRAAAYAGMTIAGREWT